MFFWPLKKAISNVNVEAIKDIKKELKANKIYLKDIKSWLYELEIIWKPFITWFKVMKGSETILENYDI